MTEAYGIQEPLHAVDARRQEVIQRINDFRTSWTIQHGGKDYGWEREVIGNFSDLVYPKSFIRESMLDPLHVDQTTRDTVRREDQEGLSKKRLDQTPKEFLSVIDKALEENGLDKDRIEKLVKSGTVIEHGEVLLPVYSELRALGYTHIDLYGRV